jgi:hypothetical protein
MTNPTPQHSCLLCINEYVISILDAAFAALSGHCDDNSDGMWAADKRAIDMQTHSDDFLGTVPSC